MHHPLHFAACILAAALVAGCAETPTDPAVAAHDPAAAPCVPVTGSRICRKDSDGTNRVQTGTADSLKMPSIVTPAR